MSLPSSLHRGADRHSSLLPTRLVWIRSGVSDLSCGSIPQRVRRMHLSMNACATFMPHSLTRTSAQSSPLLAAMIPFACYPSWIHGCSPGIRRSCLAFPTPAHFWSIYDRSATSPFTGQASWGGLAQAASYPSAFLAQFKSILFDATNAFEYQPFGVACDGYEEWSKPQNATRTKPLVSDQGPRAIQGLGLRRGILWGGCLEVLEMVKGTPWWPRPEAWRDVVLFIEGSEDVPPPELYSRVLRSWSAAGNLDRVAALLVGRARGYDDSRKQALDVALRIAISVEAGRPDMPVITNCDFGHTDPQWLLPMGCMIEVDAGRSRIALAESAVI
jgi:muramoyltetrapeptide carboxypeptidase LdcA involved in peptidoglycan recycling